MLELGRKVVFLFKSLQAGMMASRLFPPWARHPGYDRPLGRRGGVIGKPERKPLQIALNVIYSTNLRF